MSSSAEPIVFGEPTPNAVGRAALVPDGDCVRELSAASADRLLWYGEDLIRVKLPAGTRVIYPKPSIPGLPDRDAAIRYALEHPEQAAPLRSQLRSGAKVTIAIDDISLPLPKMKRPDLRQSVLAILLEMLEQEGVTDVEMVIANSFHRRMEPFEIRWSVGREIFDAFYPHRLYCHDGEDPACIVELGETELGEKVRINRRAAESDLLIYVNINLVPMDGGNKSVGVGLCDYASLQAHHNPQTIRASDSYFDHTKSPLTDSCNRMGRVVNDKLNVFHIETVVNNQMFDPRMQFFVKPEDEWNALDKVTFRIAQVGLGAMPRQLKRKVLFSVPAPYELIAVHAGATDAVHAKTLAYNYQQYCVPVDGQADVAVFGVPFICPYNVNAPMNPILVRCLTLGYFFNMYRGAPILKRGGVFILTHPLYNEFSPSHHAAYHEFFHRCLSETNDADELQRRYEAEFARDSAYSDMYRRGYGYHGVHPLYMWYWAENGAKHCGQVIVVGAEDRESARIMGWERADTVAEALEMAQTFLGRSPSVAHVHIPPINMVDVAA
ncbi:MAG: lactate racemase domain-containing protein [Bryobacterales bacterium]|nr:lactate racemase domain-containing protein [Bryobacterales bacterium]MDE0621219.1 lactate racemase domain-containing protein [Bryobacterales bacterium]